MGHIDPHGLHNPRGLHAQLQGQWHGIQAGALVHIHKVQPHGVVANAYLASTRLTHCYLHQFQLLRPAVLVYTDGA